MFLLLKSISSIRLLSPKKWCPLFFIDCVTFAFSGSASSFRRLPFAKWIIALSHPQLQLNIRNFGSVLYPHKEIHCSRGDFSLFRSQNASCSHMILKTLVSLPCCYVFGLQPSKRQQFCFHKLDCFKSNSLEWTTRMWVFI